MPRVELLPPYSGVSDQRPYAKTPGDSCPPQSMVNVRRRAGKAGELQMGVRPGLVRALSTTFPGPVQQIGVMGVVSGSRLVQGEPFTVGNILSISDAATLTGTCFFVHPTRGLAKALLDPGVSTASGTAVAFSDNLELAGSAGYGAFATRTVKDYSGAIGTRTIGRLHYFRSTTGTSTGGAPIDPVIEWSAEVEDRTPAGAVSVASLSQTVTQIVVYEPYVICIAGRWIYVFASSNGQYLARYDANGWSAYFEALAFSYNATTATPGAGPFGPDSARGNAPFIYAAYRGSPNIQGPVTANDYSQGMYYRAGLVKYRINPTTPTTPLTFVSTNTRTEQEENSGMFRWNRVVSPSANTVGRGRVVFDLATWKGLLPDATGAGERTLPPFVLPSDRPFFAVSTNDGMGPGSSTLAANQPNGSPYINAFQFRDRDINPDPMPEPIAWAIDLNSRKDNWLSTGWRNDIPFTAAGSLAVDNGFGSETTLTSVGLDPFLGDCVIGGALTGSKNLFLVRGTDGFNGGAYWSTSVGALIPSHCIQFDPANGLMVVGFKRNDAWTGSLGRFAHVAWVDTSTGTIRHHFDLGTSGANTYGVAVNRAGWTAYVTEKI